MTRRAIAAAPAVRKRATKTKTKTKRAAPAPTPPVEPVKKLLYTTPEAAAALGVCERTLYRHLLAGDLFSLRIGATRRIPIAALEAYIARQMNDYGAAS
jgi:excisionase family DNA binding protein